MRHWAVGCWVLQDTPPESASEDADVPSFNKRSKLMPSELDLGRPSWRWLTSWILSMSVRQLLRQR
jgi:hypothetical protein